MDDVWFDTALLAAGSLVAVLQIVAAVTGLSLTAGMAGLGLWHLGAALVCRASGSAPATPQTSVTSVMPRLLETIAVAILLAIAITWTNDASRSLEVFGADAAHYHVPVAVNLALGASPFDLPPTQHLYPMATSTLAAWHLLPTGDLLLVDLTTVWPFALLAASLALLFRLMTGASGLAWTTPLVLALFSTPLFRASSLMSADLLFAAAFVASIAQGVRFARAADHRALNAVLLGCAVGLLAGSKATGIPAAALVLAGTGGLFIATWGRGWRAAAGPWHAWAGATGLAVAVGGVWLLRNWMLFGSPIAPNGLSLLGIEVFPGPAFEATSYLSVLGDETADARYSIAGQFALHARAWLGPAFLLCLLPAVAFPLDAALAWWRGESATSTVRLSVLVLVMVVALPLAWLLYGAPWTSLEWTNGYSLRYVLPSFALAALLAWTAMFPCAWPWHERPAGALIVGGLAFVVAGWLFAGGQAASAPLDPPRWSVLTLILGGMAAGGWRLSAVRAGTWVRAVAVLVISAVFAVAASGRVMPARAQAVDARATAAPTSASLVFSAVIDAEVRHGTVCDRRRFVLMTRFDAPLALQSVVLDAEVFYAARDVVSAERAAPLTACDYVVTTRAVLDTDKGTALLQALFPTGRTTEIADTGAFVVLTAS